jgi:hypothetical protein
VHLRSLHKSKKEVYATKKETRSTQSPEGFHQLEQPIFGGLFPLVSRPGKGLCSVSQHMIRLDTAAENGVGRDDVGAQVCPSEIERFLHYYDEALATSDSKLALFSLPVAATFASHKADAVARHAAKLAGGQRDVYLHIHLHDLSEGTVPNRGSIESVRVAIGLFGDIDACGPGRKKPAGTLCPTVGDAISVVEDFNARYHPLPTSLLIASGHGCYPAILFKEPFVISTIEERERLESLGRRFHAALQAIASERGWTGAVDYCDLAKVLRLPGCVNWKDPSAPKTVQILHENSARFNLNDLDEALPHVDVRPNAHVSSAATPHISINAEPEAVERLVRALIANHPQFESTWNHNRTDLGDQSCSGYDMAIAAIGVASQLPDQQIANLILASRRRFPRLKQHRKGAAYTKYIERTIAKARENGGLSSEQADLQWAELSQEMKSPVESTPSAAGNCAEEAGQNPSTDPPMARDVQGEPDQGQTGGPRITSALDFLLAKVRATGDVKVAYDNIAVIASMPDSEVAVAYQELKSALGSKINYHHFNTAVKDARVRKRHSKVADDGDDPRPIIMPKENFLEENALHAIAALEDANAPAVVFRRGGRLVMIQADEDGRPVIMQATVAMMKGRLARVARFLEETKSQLRRISPPEDLTRDVLACNEGTFPALGVLTQVPILRRDGTIRLDGGYDPATRAYYRPTPGFRLGSVADEPSPADVGKAVQALDDVISQFPFESPADKANLFALLLTPLLRVAFRMTAPLALIDAPKWGTGKTLLGMVVGAVITGGEGSVGTAPTSEEEWRKRMTSILERGSPIVILDNINQTLNSPSLSAVLTTSYWEDRVLGRSEDVRLPNVSTWIGTGNNIVLGAEMARRVFRIRLDAKVANPAKRTGFKRVDHELLEWIRESRGELVAALLTMIRAWWLAGQPKADVPPFGSFNTWAGKAGGILKHAGVEGFLGNLDAVQVENDEESAQWEQFTRALAITFREFEFTASEVADQVLHDRGMLALSFPEEIGHPDERGDRDMSSLVRRIGKALARKCGTRFGDLELRIERGRPDTHTKVQRWLVAGNLAPLYS